MKSSPQRLKLFKDIDYKMKFTKKNFKKPKLDVITRWNSTYDMLERALEYKEVYRNFHFVENVVHPPTENDWQLASELCKFLKMFSDATNIFSASKTPTANLYFHNVCMINLHLKKERTNPIISEMQTKMVEKFEQYWKDYSLLLSIAAVLDPRHKMRLVEFCYKKLYGSEFNAYYPHVRRIQDAT